MQNGNVSKQHIFQKLCSEELQAKKECRHYKLLYSKENTRNKQLLQEIQKLRKKVHDYERHIDKLHQKYSRETECVPDVQSKRKKKKWSNLKCEKTKRQRISEYGNFVFQTITTHIPQCK